MYFIKEYEGVYREKINSILHKKHSNQSRWRELNPRPIPYQGIAIPLSHSGKVTTAPE
jgi:hypothetical protein